MIKIAGLLLGMALSVSTFYSHLRRRVWNILFSETVRRACVCVDFQRDQLERRWAEVQGHGDMCWVARPLKRQLYKEESAFKRKCFQSQHRAGLQGHNVASPLSCERNRKSCILDMTSSRCDSPENIVWLSWSLTLWLRHGFSCICPCNYNNNYKTMVKQFTTVAEPVFGCWRGSTDRISV